MFFSIKKIYYKYEKVYPSLYLLYLATLIVTVIVYTNGVDITGLSHSNRMQGGT